MSTSKKQLLSILLVFAYFVMGVATSQYPQVSRTPMPRSTVSISDTKHILLFDNFQNNKNDWIEGKYPSNEFYFDRGAYYMRNQGASGFAMATVNRPIVLNEKDDWVIESQLHIPNEDHQGSAYILFGKKGDDFHCFGIADRGGKKELYYGSRKEGQWIGKTISLNNASTLNHPLLSMHKIDGVINYYLNKKWVAREAAPSFYGQEIGLAVGGTLQASFDDITIKQLQFLQDESNYSTDKSNIYYHRDNENVIPMIKKRSLYYMPILVNKSTKTEFIYDQWTTDVIISEDLAQELLKAGTLNNEDCLEGKPITLGNGSSLPSSILILKQLQIGKRSTPNVTAYIRKDAHAEIIIGPSVLSQFGKFQLDVKNKILLFKSD